MKTNNLNRWRLLPTLPQRCAAMAIAVSMFGLAAAPLAHSEAVVDTLGGGATQGHPSNFGYINGNTFSNAQFYFPAGLALNNAGTTLFVADRNNHAIRKITQVGNAATSVTSTLADGTMGINHPVAITVDGSDNVYVLNYGDGTDGTIFQYNQFGNFIGARASNLQIATAMAMDGSTNFFVTANNNTVLRIAANGTVTTVGTITTPGTFLKGIAVLDSGNLALSDNGNNGVWILNPNNGQYTALTGFHGAGDTFGAPGFAQFRSPEMIAKAGGDNLVIADAGNHRVKVIDPSGNVSLLYGVSSNRWYSANSPGVQPGWRDGDGCTAQFCAEARLPRGVLVAPNGDVYTSEIYYHILRKTTGTGLTGPSGGGGGGGGTNVIIPPVISPNTGYYPMGQTIVVTSPNPNVYYTINGTEPTTNSAKVNIVGSTGIINWKNTTNDLTGLRLKAFVGTNSSVTVSGVPASTNNVGIPLGPNGPILAGVGSKVVIPVIANVRTNDRVKSFIFRVEVTPNGGAPMISDQYEALNVTSNDFISVVTDAQAGKDSVVAFQPYTIGTTRGLNIAAIGTNANVDFTRFAVVTMLAVPIPADAGEGQTYTINVLNSSATSDGGQTAVSFPPMPAATILVTNVPYTVGDSAVAGWYNAGEFGNHDLDNADVNNAFYASTGLRIPYTFTDVYDSMDAWPPDDFGFLGGDGELTFLDWQVTLSRAFGQDPNNWVRAWSFGGFRTNGSTTLVPGGSPDGGSQTLVGSPWNRQATIGAVSVGGLVPGAQANVPVYIRTANGASVKGFQFRCIITPDNNGPALIAPAVFLPSGAAPIQQSFKPSELACGWSLNTVNFGSHTSNYLGVVRFQVPLNAIGGQTYTISFANADGAPNLTTRYYFETKRAAAVVTAGAPPVTDITSDDWKLAFFGSLTSPDAGPNADPDNDGIPNWAEYIAGTSPTDSSSRLQFDSSSSQLVSGQRRVTLNWLTAPGKVYDILGSSSLSGGTWTVIGTLSGDGSVQQFTDTNPGSQRYYRLRVQP